MLSTNSTADKPEEFKLVAITVLAAAATWTNTADVELIWGKILGITPTGNQDQFIDNVELSIAGLVTVTLAANATADNTFNVAIARDTGNEA